MAKKKPVNKPKPAKTKPAGKSAPPKKIQVYTGSKDSRDKPGKIKRQSVLKNLRILERESAAKDKAANVKQYKDKKRASSSGKASGPKRGFGMTKQIKSLTKQKKSSKKVATKKPSRKKSTTSSERIDKYPNPYIEKVSQLKKQRLRKPDAEELKRIKKNYQNSTYRLKDKLKAGRKRKKNKLSKKSINFTHKQLRNLSVAVRAINRKLGIKKELKEVPTKKITTSRKKVKKGKKEVTQIIRKEIIPVWEGRDKLAELIKGGQFTHYVLDSKKFTKNQVPEIYFAYSAIEDRLNAIGSTTPHIIFIMNFTTKTCEVTEFDY